MLGGPFGGIIPIVHPLPIAVCPKAGDVSVGAEGGSPDCGKGSPPVGGVSVGAEGGTPVCGKGSPPIGGPSVGAKGGPLGSSAKLP